MYSGPSYVGPFLSGPILDLLIGKLLTVTSGPYLWHFYLDPSNCGPLSGSINFGPFYLGPSDFSVFSI